MESRGVELLAAHEEKQIWFHELARPFQLKEPFPRELYVCILFANDEAITDEERAAVCDQLVGTGCRFAVCAGHECSRWHDDVDTAYLATDEQFSPPDATFVMTTWHEGESVEDVVFQGLMSTNFDDHDFTRYFILCIGARVGLRDEVQRAIQEVWQVA